MRASIARAVLATFVVGLALQCSSSSKNVSGNGGTSGTGASDASLGGSGASGGLDAASEAAVCAAGTFDCDGDPSTCECDLPPNATPACSNGCNYACNSGFAAFESADGKGCTNFSEVGNPDKCAFCDLSDAATCQCASGYTPSEAFTVKTDAITCPTNEGRLTFCQTAQASPMSDWGGAYLKTDDPCNSNTCSPVNSYTGACTCPSLDFKEIPLRVIVNRCGAGWVYTGTLAICYNPDAPLTTFGGAYQTIKNPEAGTLDCVVKNPKTNDCKCANGTLERTFHVTWPSTPEVDSTISICWR